MQLQPSIRDLNRTRLPTARTLRLVVLGSSLLLAYAAPAAQVWTAPASAKVRPLTPVPSPAPTAAAIAAAKNEFEAFHVVVTGPATDVSVTFEGLSDGHGHTISGQDVVLYREALIHIATPSGGDGASGWWPDALVPDIDPIVGEKRNAFPFDVPAGENRVVYVDVHVPQDAPAGTYTGTLLVSGGASAQVPVTLTVWDFAMPSTATLHSAFYIVWNGPCMGHGDARCSDPAYEKPLRARYVQAALDNRVSVSVPDISTPVSTTGAVDWSAFDQYAGPFLDGTAPGRLKGARLTEVQIYGYDGTDQYLGLEAGTVSTAVAKSWSDHFKAKGWSSPIFNYLCDEPPLTCAWSDVTSRIAQSRAGDPSLKTLVTTQPYTAAANGIDPTTIDRYVAMINFLEDRPGTEFAGNQRANWPANIWLYQTCGSFGCGNGGATGWPSLAIDTDATRNRALEWMTYTFDGTGELYYEMTMAYFGQDPWVSQFNFGGNGDGTLFYPGTTAKIGGRTEIPIESLRLKGIRDGMEDYELLHMATALGLGSEAKQIALRVYPHAYQGYTTPAALETARAQLATMILHALGKEAPPASAATSGEVVASPNAGIRESGAGGCSSSGLESTWVAVAVAALFGALRRRVRP